ncbi:MAG: hypothetical protein OXC41_02730 [Gammaproteobacteria bacterium]|nr:hypothetical protein [Gammaproteobacteria bacterium]
MALIEGIEDRGAGEIATRVLQRVRAVFSRDRPHGYREVNPAIKLRNHLKPHNKRQQTVLAAEELHKVSGHSQWLMPGRLEDKPESQNTMIFAVYWMGFHKRTTVHGFRALASTILNEAVTEVDGKKHRMWSVDAVERALAHTE